jgi:competence protein ComEC
VAPDLGAHLAVVAVAAVATLAILAPGRAAPVRVAVVWMISLGLGTSALGLAAGSARVAAIDAGALELPTGRGVTVRGFVTAVPTRSAGEVRVRVDTPGGRLLVEAPEPVADLPIGSAVRARGTVREPRDWEAAWLERLGIDVIVSVRSIERTVGGRAGITGLLDGLRSRAESALGRGTTEEAASLLRGFVLGQDDRIDAATVEDFKRSGLAHLLAVSGQNVVLLAVLASVVLAVLGVPLRARLAWILTLIAIYVPVAGAGASIQRAGVMGAAGVVAALAGRPRSRWYALLLAACATLALDPRASADVGWQLSFAAVAGILLASAPIASALAGRARGWRRGLADGVALTVAATLATAPLMAYHFGTLSVVALPANMIALPAVAPVMWLGMLAAAAGQASWLPVEPLTWLAGLLAAYIAQVAAWFGDPGWSQRDVALGGPLAATGVYLGLGAMLALVLRWAGRRRSLGVRRSGGLAPLGVFAGALALLALVPGPGVGESGTEAKFRITILDVGQGDAILLEPAGAAPVLVDAGAADADVAGQLEQSGVEHLAALAITHPEDDHDGGAAAILSRIETDRLLFARLRPATRAVARAEGTRPVRLARGAAIRSGRLRLDVLWPPAERLVSGGPVPAADPNSLSLVLLARWGGFEALLTGDAEAEATPLDPGAVEVLKVAHHGSEDAGLEQLLERAQPQLGVISVGAQNSYGHPSPTTLSTLAAHEVPFLRTDSDGEIVIEAGEDGWAVR